MTCLKPIKSLDFRPPCDFQNNDLILSLEEVSKIRHPSVSKLIVFDHCNVKNEQPK